MVLLPKSCPYTPQLAAAAWRRSALQAELLSRQAADAATQAYDAAKAVTDQVLDAAAPVVEAAAPVVVQASKAAADSFKPVASELTDQAQKALSTSGVDIKPFLSAAKVRLCFSTGPVTCGSVAVDLSQRVSQCRTAPVDLLNTYPLLTPHRPLVKTRTRGRGPSAPPPILHTAVETGLDVYPLQLSETPTVLWL